MRAHVEDAGFAEAADILREALEMRRNRLGPDHESTQGAAGLLATLLDRLDAPAETE